MEKLIFATLICLAVFTMGYRLGIRANRKWFLDTVVGDEELASQTYPSIPYAVRRVNAYFPSWVKAAENYEVAKRGPVADAALQQKSLHLLTAMIGRAAQKLAEEATLSLQAQAPAMEGIDDRIVEEGSMLRSELHRFDNDVRE